MTLIVLDNRPVYSMSYPKLLNRKKTAELLFYAALTIELVLMIVEKSEISFPYESYVFRVTFLLTLLCVLITEHDKKQWLVIGIALVFTGICYYLSGKNDLLRFSVFMLAAKDIDLKKAIRYSFYVSLSGFLLIALLSVCGIMGDIYLITDYGRQIADEKRYVFGFGHPNTLFSSVYALVLMWLFLYGSRAKAWQYTVLFVLSSIVSILTRTRTGIAVLALTLILAVVLRIFPKLKDVKALYILETIVSPVMCVLSAVVAAKCSQMVYLNESFLGHKVPAIFWRIDGVLNYRISSLYYGASGHGGILSSWRLFAHPGSDEYFDMGWVRLFYWYGIIPTMVIVVLLFMVINVCLKKRDIWTMLIFFSLSVYTLVEATFVSRYIGRNFFLLIMGVYLWHYLKKGEDLNAGKA